MSAHRSWLSALCKLKCDRAHHAASTLAGKSTLVLPDMRDMCVPLNKLLSQDKGVRDGLTFFSFCFGGPKRTWRRRAKRTSRS